MNARCVPYRKTHIIEEVLSDCYQASSVNIQSYNHLPEAGCKCAVEGAVVESVLEGDGRD